MSRCGQKEREVGNGGGGAMRNAGTTGLPLLTGQLNKLNKTNTFIVKDTQL